MSSRVLLVEDNPDDEALTLRALRRISVPITVTVARDGVEALEALGLVDHATMHSAPDLVLLDIKLPKVTGLDVLRAIRSSEHISGLPVVMLTSSDEPSDVVAASLLNASRYVRKPVDYDEFIQSMTVVVQDFLTSKN